MDRRAEKQMSIDRTGNKHKPETIAKFLGRKYIDETKKKISLVQIGKIIDVDTCNNISIGKFNAHKTLSEEEKKRVTDGVGKSVIEGKYHKNKVPREEYNTIKALYLSGTINKRQLAFKYGINPASMQKLLTRIGI